MEGQGFESPMQLLTEKPEITAKNYLSVGPGEYPCGNNLYLTVTPSGGRRRAFRYQRNGIVKKMGFALPEPRAYSDPPIPVGETPRSLGASAVQNNNHCLQQDVNVEPHGPVSNIEEILRLLNLQVAVAPR